MLKREARNKRIGIQAKGGKGVKQHITKEQLNELSEKAKKRLKKWWKINELDLLYFFDTQISKRISTEDCSVECEAPSVGGVEDNFYGKVFPLLSIGQMIEFLDKRKKQKKEHLWFDDTTRLDYNDSETYKEVRYWHVGRTWFAKKEKKMMLQAWGSGYELCDALWEAVKEILES